MRRFWYDTRLLSRSKWITVYHFGCWLLTAGCWRIHTAKSPQFYCMMRWKWWYVFLWHPKITNNARYYLFHFWRIKFNSFRLSYCVRLFASVHVKRKKKEKRARRRTRARRMKTTISKIRTIYIHFKYNIRFNVMSDARERRKHCIIVSCSGVRKYENKVRARFTRQPIWMIS